MRFHGSRQGEIKGGDFRISCDPSAHAFGAAVKVKLFDLTALLVFSIMIDYRFFAGEGGIPGITLTEIVCYGMLFLLFALFSLRKIDVAQTVIPIYKSNGPLFLYFGWLVISAFLGIVFASSFEGFFLVKDSVPSLLLYGFLILYIRDLEDLKRILWVYAIGSTVGFLLGFLQGYFGGFYPVAENIAVEYKMDVGGESITENLVRGFQTHPNGFAGFYIPAVILIVVSVCMKLFVGAARKFVLAMFIPVIIFDYYYTYAKGAWAWLLLGILLLFIPKRLEKYRHIIVLISLVTGIVFIILTSIILFSIQVGSFGTIITRLQLWMAGFEAIRTHPSILLFGNGGKMMLSITPSFAGLEYPNTHNGFFNLVLFYGAPALLFFIVAVSGVLRNLSRSVMATRQELKPVGLFALSTLVALLGIYFFEPLIVGVNMQAHFFFVMAISCKFIELTEGKSDARKEPIGTSRAEI
jgi:hypothetical protein